MHIYMIDAERIGPVEDHKQQVTKERCFVEAESIAGAISLRPEDDNFEIVCVQRIGNIIARERTANAPRERTAVAGTLDGVVGNVDRTEEDR